MDIKIKGDQITQYTDHGERTLHIGSPEAFKLLTDLWIRSGWDNKYVYSFSWLGRPIIQLPEDMIRIQELIWHIKPDVIIETGVAHGGSLIFYASILNTLGVGRVIGIDIDIRAHNRVEIETHPLFKYIDLYEGSSINHALFDQVSASLKEDEQTRLVILDSNHSYEHVKHELEIYSTLVSVGSYIVVCDGIMQSLVSAPRSQPDWEHNNPLTAIEEFLSHNDHFKLIEPPFPFNEGSITQRVTYWPNCYLKKVR